MQRFECEGKITAKVTLKYGKCELPKPLEVKFDTRESTRFGELSVLQLSETFGIAFALILASVAGFQSDAFEAALVGTWRAYLTLFVWGVGADQTRNFLQNLDKFKGVDAPAQ
jgi:hypothetical protein